MERAAVDGAPRAATVEASGSGRTQGNGTKRKDVEAPLREERAGARPGDIFAGRSVNGDHACEDVPPAR